MATLFGLRFQQVSKTDKLLKLLDMVAKEKTEDLKEICTLHLQ